MLLTAFIFCIPGILCADESGTRTMNPDDLRCQMLLQEYLGKNIRVTTTDKKKHIGKLIAVDKQNLKIEVRKKTKVIPVDGIRKIEFTRSVAGEVGESVGGAVMGIGIVVGGLFLLFLATRYY